MEWKKLKDKVGAGIQKYKYALLIFVLGMFLMLIPFGGEQKEETPSHQETVTVAPSQEEKLAAILSQIDGAGKVRVMLTEKHGEITVYQTDEEQTNGENSSSIRRETVVLSDGNRNDKALVQQVNPATYQGAIIVCQGADDPVVRLKIYEAVSKVTGLGTDKIAVLKMKS